MPECMFSLHGPGCCTVFGYPAGGTARFTYLPGLAERCRVRVLGDCDAPDRYRPDLDDAIGSEADPPGRSRWGPRGTPWGPVVVSPRLGGQAGRFFN